MNPARSIVGTMAAIMIAGVSAAMAAETQPAGKLSYEALMKAAREWSDKGMEIAKDVRVDWERNDAYLEMMDSRIALGAAEETFKQIRDVFDDVPPIMEVIVLAEKLHKEPATALKAVAEYKHEFVRADGYDRLLDLFLRDGDWESAIKTAERGKSSTADSRYGKIAAYLIKDQKLKEAGEIAKKITSEKIRRRCVQDVELAEMLAVNQAAGRKEFIEKDSEQKGFTTRELAQALSRRSQAMAYAGDTKGARDIVSLIDIPDQKGIALAYIAQAHERNGQLKESLQAAHEAKPLIAEGNDAFNKLYSQSIIDTTRIRAGEAAEVLGEIEKMTKNDRMYLRSTHVAALLKLGRTDEAIKLLAQVDDMGGNAKSDIAARMHETDVMIWTRGGGYEIGWNQQLTQAETILTWLPKKEDKVKFCGGVVKALLEAAEIAKQKEK